MQTAQSIIRALQFYGWAGAAVAAAFLLFGIDRIDPSARNSFAFRALVAPGVVLLWPLVLIRWWAIARRHR